MKHGHTLIAQPGEATGSVDPTPESLNVEVEFTGSMALAIEDMRSTAFAGVGYDEVVRRLVHCALAAYIAFGDVFIQGPPAA